VRAADTLPIADSVASLKTVMLANGDHDGFTFGGAEEIT